MTYTLAIETVSAGGSIACFDFERNEELFFYQIEDRRLAQDLVPQIQKCIDVYGVPKDIAVASGPGSFTGLRVGVVAAKTLAYTDNLKIYPVESLFARACEEGNGKWLVLQSLKKDTTFYGIYEIQNGKPITIEPVVSVIDTEPPVIKNIENAKVIGDALQEKQELLYNWDLKLDIENKNPLTARGVAIASRFIASIDADILIPNYCQKSAPELQREKQNLKKQ